MSKLKFSKIFFIGADYELDNIFKDIPLISCYEDLSPFFRFKTTLDKKNLIIITGFSKTNASAAAQFAVDHFESDSFINMGLVGALNSSLNIGDVVQASECRFYDADFTAFKYAIGQLPSTDIYIYPLNTVLSNKIKKIKLISGDRFVTDKSIFSKEIMDYQPDCVEVEMTSIAHVFYINGLLDKLSSIRTVSDKADGEASKDFYNDPTKMFFKTNQVIKSYLKID